MVGSMDGLVDRWFGELVRIKCDGRKGYYLYLRTPIRHLMGRNGYRPCKQVTAMPSRQPSAQTRQLQCQTGNSLNACIKNLSAGQQKIRLVYLVGSSLSMTHHNLRS